jgi:predicted metal-dependent HD superfamily phosphohydrolase
MSEPQDLFARWRGVWQAVAVGGGDDVYGELARHYSEPHRAYHTLEHIGECLLHLDSAGHLLSQPAEVELAVWFHDAVYDPHRGDNEERSAVLAVETLLTADGDKAMAERVGDLIRLTTHSRDQLVGDGAMICDIDLAIFGAEQQRFERYDADIRREYDWVAVQIYRQERGRLLASFLARPRIFQTSFFHDRFEDRARKNLERAILLYRD